MVIQEDALDFYCGLAIHKEHRYCIKKNHLCQKQWLQIICEYPVNKI